jgi:hypothetical protein
MQGTLRFTGATSVRGQHMVCQYSYRNATVSHYFVRAGQAIMPQFALICLNFGSFALISAVRPEFPLAADKALTHIRVPTWPACMPHGYLYPNPLLLSFEIRNRPASISVAFCIDTNTQL